MLLGKASVDSQLPSSTAAVGIGPEGALLLLLSALAFTAQSCQSSGLGIVCAGPLLPQCPEEGL